MEHGKNRFFNICEAYQSMIGKIDSIGKDARRYNAINESYDVDAYDSVYIGRTDDYYSEEEDDSVFSRLTWTWAESPDDKDFAKEGPVYKLTDDGKRDFFEWLDAYQVGYSLGSGSALHGRNESPEEEWNFLTSPSNGLSVEVEGNSSIGARKFESVRERNRRGRNINESICKRINEMAMHRISYAIQDPSILAKNWDEISTVMDRAQYEMDERYAIPSGQDLLSEASELLKEASYGRIEINPEEFNLFNDFRTDFSDNFYGFLFKNGFNRGESTSNGEVLTNGSDEITVEEFEDYDTGMPFVEYSAENCEEKFYSLLKQYLDTKSAKEGWNASVQIKTPDGRFWGNSIPEVANKLSAFLSKNPKSQTFSILSQYMFDDDNNDNGEYDDILAQAEEIADEQYSDSIMAQGSDAYGDREFAKMDFLSKRIPRNQWWKYGIYDPREEIRKGKWNFQDQWESARRRNLRGRTIGESYGSARNMGNRKPESNPTFDEIDMGDEPDEVDELNDQILKLKEFIGWNPVGGVSIVSGSFKPKYGGSTVPFKPMSLEEFINSAYRVCTAEAHDVVRASTVLVGGGAYIADSHTFSELLKDDYILDDYPEYHMHEVALSFNSYYGTLTLVELFHDSYYGHGPYVFDESRGRDYILSKILSSYPFLRDYVDNSDKSVIRFSLPPTMANDIMGVANKHSERQPTLKSLEDEERYHYGTYDKDTGHYESKYDIDVRNAYKDRFGGGKDYVG